MSFSSRSNAAITWPQGAIDQIIIRMVVAQVDGDVRQLMQLHLSLLQQSQEGMIL